MDKTKCIDKMNIAIYNYQEFNEYIGGIERVSISLTRSLIKRDVNVIFVAVHKSQYNIEYRTPVPMFFLPDEDATSVNNIKEFKRILAEQNLPIIKRTVSTREAAEMFESNGMAGKASL